MGLRHKMAAGRWLGSALWLYCCAPAYAAQPQPAHQSPECVLRFALDTSFPPHIVLTPQQPEGLNVQMIRLLAAQVGCRVRFVNSPWARALKLLQQGEIDVISQLTYNQIRAKDIAFIGPHHQERMWLIADPAKVPPLRQLADLPQWPASLLIAVLNGGYFGPQLQQLRDDPVLQRRFYPMVSNQDKLALLESGRVQAVLEEELAWFWRVKGQATVYRPLLLVHADPVYFGFSRVSVSPELLRRLDAAWLQLYQSGQLQQIRDYYLATPTADLAPGAAAGSAAEISRMPAPAPFL